MKVIISSQAGARWQEATVTPSTPSGATSLKVDVKQHFQTHLGFGGSMTEAAAYTIKENHDEATIQRMLDLYFSTKGLAYNFTRIHMNSSDFALGNYTYVDYGDQSLSTFSLAREQFYVLPMLKKVLKQKPDLHILISPWSPPGWMKDNAQMNHGGSLKPEHHETWAKYYVKFIQALQQEGIQPWGVSVQNEPAAKQVWDSCLFTAEQERDFIKHHLGPKLKQHFGDQIQLLVWDHNRDIMVERVTPIYQDKEASQYVWGTGFHWYGEEAFANVGRTKALFPDKHLLFTEGCIEGGPRPGAWDTGERYARNMIGDFLQGNEGFIDWNLVLNEQGGPNHVGNYCDAPILFDRRNQTIIQNSSYYVIGHFSKFIPPHSIRIALTTILPQGVLGLSYLTPNQQVVVVLLNQTETPQTLTIGKQPMAFTLPAKAIATVIVHEKELA
jgi:glucosylceramidase